MNQDLEFGKFGFPNWASVYKVLLGLESGIGLDCFVVLFMVFTWITMVTRVFGCKRTCILSRTVQDPFFGS